MSDTQTVQCSLCGLRFAAENAKCMPVCPLKASCAFICCPRCGYQMVDTTKSASANLLRRLWSNRANRIEKNNSN